MSHTYAVLQVSAATYAEIREKLKAAGYEHAFHVEERAFRMNDRREVEVIDMHGIALSAIVVDNGCVGDVHVFPNTWPGAKCECGSQIVGGPMPTR